MSLISIFQYFNRPLAELAAADALPAATVQRRGWRLDVGNWKRCIAFLGCLLFPWISSHAVQQIKVPLGCSWGDDPAKLDELIHAGGLTMISSETIPATQKKLVTVRGVISSAALNKNIFVFRKEELVEIEYQYGNSNWDAKKYQEFFDNVRRMFENKYGPGTPRSKTTSPQNNSGGITTSINGYEWAQSLSILDLFYYTAERGNQSYRLISVHYKMP